MYQIQMSNMRKPILFPENWGEVSRDQLFSLIANIHQYPDDEEMRLYILRDWMKLSTEQFTDTTMWNARSRRIEPNSFLIAEYVEKLFPLIDPFLTDVGIERFIVDSIQIPSFIPTTLYGPSDRLENVSAEEFSFASNYYQKYLENTSDTSALYDFIACLYRPKRTDGIRPGHPEYNGDLRQPFNSNNIESISQQIARVHPYKLYSIRFCFERVMKWYHDLPEYHEVFQKGEERKETYVDWDKIIRSVSGEKLGSIERVRQMPIFEIFNELQYLEEELQTHERNNPIPSSNIRTL